jgi:hypothetical protein
MRRGKEGGEERGVDRKPCIFKLHKLNIYYYTLYVCYSFLFFFFFVTQASPIQPTNSPHILMLKIRYISANGK